MAIYFAEVEAISFQFVFPTILKWTDDIFCFEIDCLVNVDIDFGSHRVIGKRGEVNTNTDTLLSIEPIPVECH